MKCHYTNETREKESIKIGPLITMKYDINMKYGMDLSLKLLRENGWFSVWSSFQISWHTYLILTKSENLQQHLKGTARPTKTNFKLGKWKYDGAWRQI